MLGHVSVAENARSDEFEQFKEEWDRLMKEVNAYKMGKKKLEKMLLKKEVTMKAMTRSVVHLEQIVSSLETEKNLLIFTSEELVSCR